MTVPASSPDFPSVSQERNRFVEPEAHLPEDRAVLGELLGKRSTGTPVA
jgi:hypothetical protein